MVLAGSIAATALPLTASATFDGNVTIRGGDLDYSTVYASDIGETSFTGGVLHDNTDYLNANNMWAVTTSYYNPETGSGSVNATVSGNNLAGKLNEYKESNNSHKYTLIKYSHQYVVTTEDPQTTYISAASSANATTFPVNVSSPSPLAPITGYTVWYGVTNDGSIGAGSAVKAGDTTTLLEPADSISIPMSAFAGLYTADIPDCYYDKTFQDGVTIIQLTYKTLNIPVLNGLGKPEMIDDVNPYTLSVTKDCYDDLDDDQNWYYVGYTNQNGEVVLSDYFVNNKNMAWAIIEGFAEKDQNFDVNTLFFLRALTVSVCKDSTETIGSFTSKDLYPSLAKNDTENLPAAYKYIVDADINSIWRTDTSQKFVLGKDLLKVIETYLDNNPSVSSIYLTETTEIVVTGTEPAQNERTESYETSPLYVEDTDPVQTVPATISDHAAVLAKSVAPEAGNIYDTSNWQLWGCGFSSGGVEKRPIVFYQKSALESTNGVTSIGIDQLNTLTNSHSPLIYFPQVKIAPSLEVTAPVVGETLSFDYTIKDTVGGYSVDNVEWSCPNTLLGENDKFKAGNEYTVEIVLRPDEGLSFTDDTPVTINGEKADIEYEKEAGLFYASYTFPALPAASVAGHSLVLADSIGVKFYMELADDLLSDDTAKMTFTVNGKQTIIPVSEGQRATLNDRTVYAFTCYVAAAEMTDQITAQVTAADYSSEEFTYNVQTYAKYILDNPATYSEYVPVVEAMLNYGAEAQKYFKHNTETLANNILDEGDKTTDPVTLPELKSYNYTCSDRDADIDFAGYTISLKSRITAKLYFEGADLTKDKITVLAGKQEVDLNRLTIGSDSNGTYLAISDINAGDFDQSFTISVGGITIDKFSVYSYLYQCLKKDRTDLKNIVNTLYAYNEAVKEII